MILQTKYFDLETDMFSFKNPESIRQQLEEKYRHCFTDEPHNETITYNDQFKIHLKYKRINDFLSINPEFPIEELLFPEVGCIEGYKIMDDDYTCRGFHYEPYHTYSIEEDPVPCEKGFHFCRELANCFNYYRPTSHSDMAHNITYDLDVFKFFNVKSNGITYKLGDKYCTNNITILEECSTKEILEAFKERFNELLFRPNEFKVKLRDELYEYYDNCFHKIIQSEQSEKLEKLDNQPTWTFYIPEED